MSNKFSNYIHTQLCVWISAAFLFLLESCGDATTTLCDFPIEQQLTAETANISSELYKAYSVSFLNNKYIFSKKGDFFLTITDADFKNSYEALRKGHGENEWIAPMLTRQHVMINGKKRFCVLERSNGVLYATDIEDSLPNRIQLADLSKMGIPNVRNVFLLSDGKMVGQRDSEKCEWFICNKNDTKASIVDSDMDNDLFLNNSIILSQGLAAYNEISKTFAQTYFAYPLLYFLDEDCKVKKRIHLSPKMPSYTEKSALEPFDYIVDMFSSNEYIYILFDSPEIETLNTMYILVIDWNANPVAKLQIGRSLAFTIDEISSTVIAINEDDEKGCFSIYKFKKFSDILRAGNEDK